MTTQQRSFSRFSWGVVAVTLGVILWGAYVRASGSGAGCGSSWPTCNGEVIPRPKSIQTVIEFTHRATSGLSFLAVLAQYLWARRVFAAGEGARRAAGVGLFFMVTEALVGAGLVLFELVAGDRSVARACWAAVHLTNTFLLVAALTAVAFWSSVGGPGRLRPAGARGALGLGALAGTLVLGASGAVTALGDTLFQAKTLAEGIAQDLAPSAHFLVKLRVVHPVVGLVVCVFLLSSLGSMVEGKGDPLTRRLAALTGGLFLGQVGLGFLNLGLLAPIPLQILHLLVADLVWMSLTLLVAVTVCEPAPRPSGA